jgi:ERCC4-type nuclease
MQVALSYTYTKTELQELLNSLIMLIDTREQENQHITGYLNKIKIPYKSKALEVGDYSFILPANNGLGINRDIYFNNDIVIERKAGLNELSNNFTHNRTQFENELIKTLGAGARLILLIENARGYENIIKHNYRTDYNPKSFIGTLHSFRHRYNMEIMFIEPAYSGNFMYYTFYYWLREYLK